MANSSLVRTGEQAPVIKKGHDIESLGPSDRSDTGSDIAGGPGLADVEAENLERGTTSDADRGGGRKTAGPDVGDENLDSDSDSGGTGERGAAGRDASLPVDQQLRIIDAGGKDADVPDEDLNVETIDDDSAREDVAAEEAETQTEPQEEVRRRERKRTQPGGKR